MNIRYFVSFGIYWFGVMQWALCMYAKPILGFVFNHYVSVWNADRPKLPYQHLSVQRLCAA